MCLLSRSTVTPTRVADGRFRNARHQIVAVLHRLAVHGDDDVVGLQPGLVRRSALVHVADQYARAGAQPLEQLGLVVALVPFDSDGPARHPASPDDVVIHARHHIDGQREADALISAALRRDHGVDADHLAANIQQRSAAVAGIDGRIGLNEALQLQRTADVAAERAHDPRRHRSFQTKRRADRHRPIAHLHGVRIADGHRNQRSSWDRS